MHLLKRDRALARDCLYDRDAGEPPAAGPVPPGRSDCDVAVVGGGLAGLSAALDLAARGFRVVLLEAQALGSGASGRNGGQAIHGLACEIDTIESQLGAAGARQVWAMSLEALDLLHERIAAHGIDCDWRAGFLAVATSPGKARALHAATERLAARLGYPQQAVGAGELRRWVDSPRYHGGAYDPRSGHLHPLKYLRGLARAAAAAGVRLHEHSPVRRLVPGPRARLELDGAEVHARHVVLAGNVHGATLPGTGALLGSRIMPVGTFIAATEPLPAQRLQALIPCGAAVCDTDFVLDYFRPTADRRLLYGGRVSYSTRAPADLAASMRRRIEATFPQLRGVRIDHAWGGFVDITMNRAPHFGRLPGPAAHAPVYFLQGFSGHGLALSGLAGRLAAEAVAGDASRLDLFARLRHHPFPGGRLLRTPALVLAMAWLRLRDLLG